MSILMPNYEHSVLNTTASILKYYGVNNCNLFLKPNEVSIESYDLFDNIQLACEKYLYHVKNNHVISLVVD